MLKTQFEILAPQNKTDSIYSVCERFNPICTGAFLPPRYRGCAERAHP